MRAPAAAAATPKNALRLKRSLTLRLQFHGVSGLRAWLALTRSSRLAASWPQHDQGTDDQHEAAKPNPPNERIDRKPKDGLFRAIHQTSQDDIQVHAQPAHDAHFGRRLERRAAQAIDVLALFGPQAADG